MDPTGRVLLIILIGLGLLAEVYFSTQDGFKRNVTEAVKGVQLSCSTRNPVSGMCELNADLKVGMTSDDWDAVPHFIPRGNM